MVPFVRLFKRKARFMWQGMKPYNYGKVAYQNLRGERMTCSAYVPIMEDDQGAYTPLGSVPDQPARPRRRRAERHPAVSSRDTSRIRAVSRDGVRGTAALMALMLLTCALGAACLVDYSQVLEAGKRVSRIQDRIDAISLRNEELEMELAMSAAEVNVSYQAVQLGMISARGVNVIYLTAPENANMIPSTSANGLTGEYLATILGD